MSSVQIRFLFHYFFCSCLSTDKVIVRVLGYGVMWQQLMTTLGLRIYHPGFVIQSWPGEYKEFLSAANIKPVETPTAPHLFRKSPASGLPQKHTHMRAHTHAELLKGALLWPLCRTDCGLSPLFNGKLKRSSLPSASCVSLSVCAHRESRS